MNKLIILFLLSACAVDVNHKASGEMKMRVEFDPELLLKGFTQACTESGAANVDACVNQMLGNYFRALVQAKAEESVQQ